MKTIACLEQLFAFADIRSLSQYLLIYLLCPFLQVYEGDLHAKLY